MTDYTITTDFGAKDSLPSGNAAKVIKGSEFTTEFTNILTAVNSKADSAGDTFTGAVIFDAAVTLNADVTFDTNTMFVDVSENRVGIGNVAPATALDVTGTVTADGLTVDGDATVQTTSGNTSTFLLGQSGVRNWRFQNIATTGELQVKPTPTTTAFEIDTNGDISFYEDTGTTAKFFWDASAESLGIGTSSPASKLHVQGTGTTAIQVTGGSGNVAGIYLGDAGGLANGRLSYSNADNSLQLFTDGSERMRIDSSGNVLVGTTEVDVGYTDSGAGCMLGSEGTLQLARSSVNANLYLNKLDNDGEIINFRKDGITVGSIGTKTSDLYIGTTNSSNHCYLRFAYNNTRIVPATNTGEPQDNALDLGDPGVRFKDLYLSGTGYFGTSVGIGTTSPSVALEVNGTVKADTHFTSSDSNVTLSTSGSGGAVRLRPNGISSENGQVIIDSSGNVGIGTTSPSKILHISDTSSSCQIMLTSSNTTTAGIIFGDSDDSATGHLLYNHTDNALTFGGYNNTERMRIDSSGNLLVGTTSTASSTTGFKWRNDLDRLLLVADGSTAAQFGRLTSDGGILSFQKDGTTVGSIGTRASYLNIGSGDTGFLFNSGEDIIQPESTSGGARDAAIDLGASGARFKDIYRSGSTYSTSDRNKKQDIRDLTDAEARVAVVAKGSLKAFRYIDTVEAEGDDANIHFGIIAQDLKAAFEAEGLNADSYQVLKTSTYTDDDGVEQTTYSVCYENLLAFIISAI